MGAYFTKKEVGAVSHRHHQHHRHIEIPPVVREQHPRFIVFEGIDGSGKGTQIQLLGEYLESRYRAVWLTREPTDGPEGTRIRKVLRGEIPRPGAEEFQRWYTCDRERHLNEIQHHLRKGAVVLCDRYYYSTVVYGVADGAPFGKLWAPNKRFLRPGLTLWLKISPVVAMARIDNARARELFEKSLLFQGKVDRQYQLLLSRRDEFGEMKAVNAERPLVRVGEVIRREVLRHLNIPPDYALS